LVPRVRDGDTLLARGIQHKLTERERAALHKCQLFMEAFRIIRPTMPMQHAYAFLLVAAEEGRGVQEYAERAGVTQSVMTRILLALGPRGQKGAPGYGLVQQATDTVDLRKHQTFLTAKGKALIREIVRLTRSDHQNAPKLRAQSRSFDGSGEVASGFGARSVVSSTDRVGAKARFG